MKETLTCSNCKKNWKRDKSRGRKPTLCPKCIKILSREEEISKKSKLAMKTAPFRKVSKPPTRVSPQPPKAPVKPSEDSPKQPEGLDIRQVFSILSPKPRNYRELSESTKNGSIWQCPVCKIVVEINIAIVQPPAHRCTPTTVTEKEFVRID
jgi:hypothetical protein